MRGILRDLFRALIFRLPSNPLATRPLPLTLETRPLPHLHKGICCHQIPGPRSPWNPASFRTLRDPYHWTCWSRSWSLKQRRHARGPSPSSTWISRDVRCAPPSSGSYGCALWRNSGRPSVHLGRTRHPRGDAPGKVRSMAGCRRGPQGLPLCQRGPRWLKA